MQDAQPYARTLCTTLYKAYSALPHPSPFYPCARLLGVLPPGALTPPPRHPPAPSVHARTGTRAPCKHFAQHFACIVHNIHLARFDFWAISCITHDIVLLDILLDILLPGSRTLRPPAAFTAPAGAAAAGDPSICRGGRGPGRPRQPPDQGFTVPPAAPGRRGGSIKIPVRDRKRNRYGRHRNIYIYIQIHVCTSIYIYIYI